MVKKWIAPRCNLDVTAVIVVIWNSGVEILGEMVEAISQSL